MIASLLISFSVMLSIYNYHVARDNEIAIEELKSKCQLEIQDFNEEIKDVSDSVQTSK